MGSMCLWRALRPVGNAQRPWLSGPTPVGLQADAWHPPNGDQLHARPDEPPRHWKALAFWARPGSDKSYKRAGG
jgi:hypothetical protein